MNAKLDDLELVLVKHENDEPSSPIQELRAIHSVWTSDRRSVVEHRVPGTEASVLQDLGRHSLRFAFAGELIGPEGKTATESLWQKFQRGKVVPFSSDIVALSDVTKVMIEQLDFADFAGEVDHYRYRLVLREYKEPRQPGQAAPAQSQEAQENVQEETEDAAGSVNYITGKVLDAEKNPVKDTKVLIKGGQGEFEIKTDETGAFRKDDLQPGTYEVVVDAPGYEDQKRKVEVKPAEREEEGASTEG